MKVKLTVIIFLIVSLSKVSALDNGKPGTTIEPTQDSKSVTPFVFSFYDSADPAMNPFAELTTNFHLTIISGRVGSVNGLQIGGLFNHVKYDFIGYDATGISSTVGGDFSGFQSTGIYNHVDGSYVGIQEAGIYNRINSNFLGIQTAGVINRVEGLFEGIQTAGIYNYSQQGRGIQTAGVINHVEGSFEGIQTVGIYNLSQQMKGMQIAGIVNVADQVNGIQIGLVNLSDKLDGIAIGLVNISKAGSIHAIGWSGGAMNLNAGIKFAPNDYWYTVLSLGREGEFADDKDKTSIGYYMGFHIPIPLAQKFYTELDIGSNSVFNGDLFDDRDFEDKVSRALETRASLGFRLHRRLSLFAGLVHTRTGKNIDWFSGGKTETSPFFGIQF